MYFFFFKQKTAYEMRISDWSSDVCSSDLSGLGRDHPFAGTGNRQSPKAAHIEAARGASRPCWAAATAGSERPLWSGRSARARPRYSLRWRYALGPLRIAARSGEHTSELQSLMRISYAVFGLKKK